MPEPFAPLIVQTAPGQFTLSQVDGTPVLTQHAGSGTRPYLHPIHAPGGGVVTEDRPGHHPWQHGLYIGFNDVNGIGFWKEGLQESTAATDGSFDSRLLAGPQSSASGTAWKVATDYRDSDGATMLHDVQCWTVRILDARLELDLDWTLTAARHLVFGQFAYGGLFLRMPYRSQTGGLAIDSEGNSQDGQSARWVAVSMALAETGEPVEVAMLDHPGNPGSPAHWRIDGELGIGPAPSIPGPWSLAEGEARRLRYRLLVWPEPVEPDTIDATWQRYASEGQE